MVKLTPQHGYPDYITHIQTLRVTSASQGGTEVG